MSLHICIEYIHVPYRVYYLINIFFLALAVPIDVAVVFDSAGSGMDSSLFARQKKILKILLGSYPFGKDGTQLGVIVNGDRPMVSIYPSTEVKSTVMRRIDDLSPVGSGSNLLSSLKLAVDDIFKRGRKSAVKTLIVFSNSKRNVADIDALRDIDTSGLKVIAIGLGDNANLLDLSKIAKNNGIFVTSANEKDDIDLVANIFDELDKSKLVFVLKWEAIHDYKSIP